MRAQIFSVFPVPDVEKMLKTCLLKTHRHREQTYGCQAGAGWGRDGVGGWVKQMQTIIYRMDKQQGPTVQHRELYSIPCDKP